MRSWAGALMMMLVPLLEENLFALSTYETQQIDISQSQGESSPDIIHWTPICLQPPELLELNYVVLLPLISRNTSL